MWLLEPSTGFFSVVARTDDPNVLTVRARARHDLDTLRRTYLPDLTETDLDTKGSRDYPARAYCTRAQWAQAVGAMALDIDYSNFKSAVGERQGWDRMDIYHDVWDVLTDLESLDPTPGRKGPWKPIKPEEAPAPTLDAAIAPSPDDEGPCQNCFDGPWQHWGHDGEGGCEAAGCTCAGYVPPFPDFSGCDEPSGSYWDTDPDLLHDWKEEVYNGETLLGYHLWAAERSQEDLTECLVDGAIEGGCQPG